MWSFSSLPGITDCNLVSASNTTTVSRTPDSQEEDSCTVYLTTSKHSAETVLSEQRDHEQRDHEQRDHEQRDHVVQVEET